MNSTCKPIFATLFLFIASHTLFAQLQTSKTEIGINVGSLIYQGDLSRSFIGNYKSLHPALGLYVSKALDPYFSLRGNLTLGKISEDGTQLFQSGVEAGPCIQFQFFCY